MVGVVCLCVTVIMCSVGTVYVCVINALCIASDIPW